MAHFITFEGIEGSGKSSQIAWLAESLRRSGHEVIVTREPGGTELSNQIRALLLAPAQNVMHPTTELLLYEASRAEHVAKIILPALSANNIVLCDRFTDATLAYQGYGRGIKLALLNQLNEVATGNLQPDLTLLFDCPVEIGLSRARSRNAAGVGFNEGRFEAEALEFHQRVRDGYLELARGHSARFRVLNADKSSTILHEETRKIIDTLLSGN